MRSRTSPNATLLDFAEDRHAMDPASNLTATEAQHAFAMALERVTNPIVRRVLELRLVAGLPYAAVTKATGVPHGTVATWVHRFRHSLRLVSCWAA
jgi:DNA-directed RNA polymerase specialized sigma24 family protein